jgi:hypothetical protein
MLHSGSKISEEIMRRTSKEEGRKYEEPTVNNNVDCEDGDVCEGYDVILEGEEAWIFTEKSEKAYPESIALMKKMKLDML